MTERQLEIGVIHIIDKIPYSKPMLTFRCQKDVLIRIKNIPTIPDLIISILSNNIKRIKKEININKSAKNIKIRLELKSGW